MWRDRIGYWCIGIRNEEIIPVEPSYIQSLSIKFDFASLFFRLELRSHFVFYALKPLLFPVFLGFLNSLK
jgi:hypothetical protein